MTEPLFYLLMFLAGLGYGYTVERASQGGDSVLPFIPQREPAWVADLDPAYQDVVSKMKQKGFTIHDNAPVCRQQDVVGYYFWGQHNIKVCSDRIAKQRDDASAIRLLLQQTVAHEAVHVAQHCRHARSGKPTLQLAAARLYSLPTSARSLIQKSLASNPTNHPRSVQWRIEAEAWAMEDTPDQVIAALQRFCS